MNKGTGFYFYNISRLIAVRGYYKAVSNLMLRLFVVQMKSFQRLIHTSPPTDARPVKMLGPHPADYDSVGLG